MSESISSWLVCTCSVALSVRLQSKRWVTGSLWVNHECSREAAKVMHACLHLFPFPWLLSPQVSVKWILLQYCSSHISPDRAFDLARENGAEMQDLFNALFPLLLSAQFQHVCPLALGNDGVPLLIQIYYMMLLSQESFLNHAGTSVLRAYSGARSLWKSLWCITESWNPSKY